ncbi:hypothetical protein Tco_0090952, partial [Tanacetum coccineum]
MQLSELMNLCTQLQSRVLDLETSKAAQAKEIKESSAKESLGAEEDTFKQGRNIADLDANAEVTLVDKTKGRNNEEILFDVNKDLQGEEVVVEEEVAKKEVSTVDPVSTAGEVVTTASATTTIDDELTLAKTLIAIKAAKPKAITTPATNVTPVITRPKVKGVVIQEPGETTTKKTIAQPPSKDKGKEKMDEF